MSTRSIFGILTVMAATTSPVTVLTADDILSRRHVPSLLGLAMTAGAVNAGAFVVCERFVTHVTGTVTRIGLDFGQWLLVFEYALVLLAFVAGAMASVLAMQRRAARGQRPRPDLPLVATAALLVFAATAGHAGVFGASAETIEQAGDFAFLSIIAFAMGLMNATVASATALAIRTTHMTGPASDLGVSLGSVLVLAGESRRQALKLAALRAGKLISFVVGAAVMLPLAQAVGYLAFLVPAATIAVATVRSFEPVEEMVVNPGISPRTTLA